MASILGIINPFRKAPAAMARAVGPEEFARGQARIMEWEQVLAGVGCCDRDLARDLSACLGSFGFSQEHTRPKEMAEAAMGAAPAKAWMSPEQADDVLNAVSAKCTMKGSINTVVQLRSPKD